MQEVIMSHQKIHTQVEPESHLEKDSNRSIEAWVLVQEHVFNIIKIDECKSTEMNAEGRYALSKFENSKTRVFSKSKRE